MKILVASIVRQHPEVLRHFLRNLAAQELPPGVSVAYAFVDDNIESESKMVLSTFERPCMTLQPLPKPPDAAYAVEEATHRWTIPTFHWLAQQKQELLRLAQEGGYAAMWLLDSDLMCSPRTLASLLATGKDVVSAVFWTRWTEDAPALPQVWLSHPYEFQGRGLGAEEFLESLCDRACIQVGGLGACTLIRDTAFPRVQWWPLVPHLPAHGMWQGEDRHFCVHAARSRVTLHADAWPDVFHCYRPSDIPTLATLQWGVVERPALGDLISFEVEPLEIPGASIIRRIRGRLGQIRMLPELEATLGDMKVGEERIVALSFPRWYPLTEYRESEKLVRIHLLDAKPFELPLGLTSRAPVQEILDAFVERT